MIYHLMVMCHYLLLVEVFFFIGLNWWCDFVGWGLLFTIIRGEGGVTCKISVFSLSSLQYHITVCFSEVGYKESAEMSEFWMCYEIFILIIIFFLFLYLYQYVLKQFLCPDQDIHEYLSFFHSCFRLWLFICVYC